MCFAEYKTLLFCKTTAPIRFLSLFQKKSPFPPLANVCLYMFTVQKYILFSFIIPPVVAIVMF